MELVDVVDSKSTVASPSAASGGCSEGAASAAVDEGRRRSRQGDRRSPQTLATYAAEGSHLVKIVDIGR